MSFSSLHSNLISIHPSSTGFGDASCLLSNSECQWASLNQINSSIEFSFDSYRFILTSYSITYKDGMCPYDEWIVEGSNNRQHYHTIHYQPKNDEIFMCQIDSTKQCIDKTPYSTNITKFTVNRYIKLTALGQRICNGGAGYYYFNLEHIDLEGKLVFYLISSYCRIAIRKNIILFVLIHTVR